MLVGPLLGDPEGGFNPVTHVSEVDSSLFEYFCHNSRTKIANSVDTDEMASYKPSNQALPVCTSICFWSAGLKGLTAEFYSTLIAKCAYYE